MKLTLQTKCNRTIHKGWDEIDFTTKCNQTIHYGKAEIYYTHCIRNIHIDWDEIDLTNFNSIKLYTQIGIKLTLPLKSNRTHQVSKVFAAFTPESIYYSAKNKQIIEYTTLLTRTFLDLINKQNIE